LKDAFDLQTRLPADEQIRTILLSAHTVRFTNTVHGYHGDVLPVPEKTNKITIGTKQEIVLLHAPWLLAAASFTSLSRSPKPGPVP
jgi:hypothetical protein